MRVICPKCGFLDFEEKKVCANCGAVLPTPSSPAEFADTDPHGFRPVPSSPEKAAPSSPGAAEPQVITGEVDSADVISIEFEDPDAATAPVAAAVAPSERPAMPEILKTGLTYSGVVSGMLARGAAAVLDGAIILLIFGAFWHAAGKAAGLTVASLWSPALALPAALLLTFVIAVYHGYFNGVAGSSPAKALLQLRVVREDGSAPGFWRAALRGLLAALGFLLVGLGPAWAILSPSRRGPHDLLAGTYVVRVYLKGGA